MSLTTTTIREWQLNKLKAIATVVGNNNNNNSNSCG